LSKSKRVEEMHGFFKVKVHNHTHRITNIVLSFVGYLASDVLFSDTGGSFFPLFVRQVSDAEVRVQRHGIHERHLVSKHVMQQDLYVLKPTRGLSLHEDVFGVIEHLTIVVNHQWH